MSTVKCCKPKCSTSYNDEVCGKENIKEQERIYFILFIFLNIVVILARFKELDFNKYKNKWNLLFFIVWLEIQILFSIIILSLFMSLISVLDYNWKMIKEAWILIISKHKESKMAKKLGAGKAEEVGLKAWYFIKILWFTFISIVLITIYVIFLFLFGPILLGYTKIY